VRRSRGARRQLEGLIAQGATYGRARLSLNTGLKAFQPDCLFWLIDTAANCSGRPDLNGAEEGQPRLCAQRQFVDPCHHHMGAARQGHSY
jgi:hypothetical protein